MHRHRVMDRDECRRCSLPSMTTHLRSTQTSASTAELYFEVRGSGAPVLLIAGTPGDGGQFDELADVLARDHLVITYDRLGTSRSPAPPAWTETTVADQADDAAGLLRRLVTEPATVYGTSNGAAVALELALRHPALVSRAILHEMPLLTVLADPAPVGAMLGDLIGGAMAAGGPPAALDAFVRFAYGDAIVDAWPERPSGSAARQRGDGLRHRAARLPGLPARRGGAGRPPPVLRRRRRRGPTGAVLPGGRRVAGRPQPQPAHPYAGRPRRALQPTPWHSPPCCSPTSERHATVVRVLLTAAPSIGHIAPLLGVATALRDAGHELRLATHASAHDLALHAGLDVIAAGMSEADMLAERRRRWPDTEHQPPSAWGVRMFTQILAPAMIRDLRAIVEDWHPQLLIHEEGEYAGPLAAATAGIPCVTHGWGSPLRSLADLTALEADAAPLWDAAGVDMPAAAGLYRDGLLNPCPAFLQADPPGAAVSWPVRPTGLPSRHW